MLTAISMLSQYVTEPGSGTLKVQIIFIIQNCISFRENFYVPISSKQRTKAVSNHTRPPRSQSGQTVIIIES